MTTGVRRDEDKSRASPTSSPWASWELQPKSLLVRKQWRNPSPCRDSSTLRLHTTWGSCVLPAGASRLHILRGVARHHKHGEAGSGPEEA